MDDNIQISDDAKTIMQTVAMAYKVYRSAGIGEVYAFELAKDFQHELLIAPIIGEDDINIDDL